MDQEFGQSSHPAVSIFYLFTGLAVAVVDSSGPGLRSIWVALGVIRFLTALGPPSPPTGLSPGYTQTHGEAGTALSILTFVLVSQPVLATGTYVVAWPQGYQFLGGGMWHTGPGPSNPMAFASVRYAGRCLAVELKTS